MTMQIMGALLDNLYEIWPSALVGATAVAASAVCGAAIGWERERAGKPVGLTTMALICMGAAVYTQSSLMLGVEQQDTARVAAQVVTGIGFLGAGAIIRNRGMIIGITTASTIWAVGALGLVVGAGYVGAGLALAMLILAILTGVGRLEQRLSGPCKKVLLHVSYTVNGGLTEPALQRILDEDFLDDTDYEFATSDPPEGSPEPSGLLTVRYCRAHRFHRRVAGDLSAHPAVIAMDTIPPATGGSAPSKVAT